MYKFNIAIKIENSENHLDKERNDLNIVSKNLIFDFNNLHSSKFPDELKNIGKEGFEELEKEGKYTKTYVQTTTIDIIKE